MTLAFNSIKHHLSQDISEMPDIYKALIYQAAYEHFNGKVIEANDKALSERLDRLDVARPRGRADLQLVHCADS